MPDASGKLTQEDNAKLQQWWATNWKGDVVCPVCKSTEWITGSYVVQFNRYAALNTAGGLTFPHVMVISPCGHAMFFNATRIGLYEAFVPPEETTDAATEPVPTGPDSANG